MGRIKTGNSKKSFMREHDCRFCLHYGTCAHKECMFDGNGTADEREFGKNSGANTAENARTADSI